MALTGTDRGNGTHNTAATSFTLAPASNLTAGAMAVLCVASDNAAASGVAFGTWAVTDTKGNTWIRQQTPLNDPGAASAGITGAIFTTGQNGGTLTTGDTITVSFGSDSPTAKAWTLMEVTGSTGVPTYVTGGTGTSGTGTTSPTITTGSIAINDMVIGMLVVESGTTQTFTGDADTTNGSWSTQQTNKIGSTTSGVGISTQRKVVSAAATQTFNPTLGLSGDLALAWIEVREAANVTATPGVASLTTSAFAPTVTTTNNQIVTPGVASLATSSFTPTVTATDHKTATPPTASLTTSTFAPTVTASDHKTVTPGTASVVLTMFDPTVTATSGTVVTPSVANLSLTAFAPGVVASDHKIATPNPATLALSGLAPSVTVTDHKTVTPTTAPLSLTAFAPNVVASDHKIVTPGVASLLLQSFAPGVGSPIQAIPGAAALSLTAFAPIVSATAHQLVTPDTAAMVLASLPADVFVTDHQLVTPDTAALVLRFPCHCGSRFRRNRSGSRTTTNPIAVRIINRAYSPITGTDTASFFRHCPIVNNW